MWSGRYIQLGTTTTTTATITTATTTTTATTIPTTTPITITMLLTCSFPILQLRQQFSDRSTGVRMECSR